MKLNLARFPEARTSTNRNRVTGSSRATAEHQEGLGENEGASRPFKRLCQDWGRVKGFLAAHLRLLGEPIPGLKWPSSGDQHCKLWIPLDPLGSVVTLGRPE